MGRTNIGAFVMMRRIAGHRLSLRAHPILRPRGLETFETAAILYRVARRRGLTVQRSVDCLIAATCLEAGAELYHNDRDFDSLARVSDLAIYRPRS
jgi:predicted nucleic acid-binding protein